MCKVIDSDLKEHGAVKSMKDIFLKHNICCKFGGGYDGSACKKMLYNVNSLWEDPSGILGSAIEPHLLILKDFQFIHSVMSMDTFTPEDLTKLNEQYNIHCSTFQELHNIYETKCQAWLSNHITHLPHVGLNFYVHYVCAHTPQLLLRDGSIGLHSGDAIEQAHQAMKMDIRRHLGAGDYTKTLLWRWCLRAK